MKTPIAAALTAAALALPAACVWAGGLDSLEQFVKNTRSGKADFTQVVTTPGKDGQTPRAKTQTGSFAFQRPGKFRFDYRKPFEQTIVADGQTLWLYDADLNQVTARQQAQALGSTPAAIIAAAPDLKALERDFTLTEEPGQDGQQWVKAVPKTRDGQLQAIRVGFRSGAKGAELSTLEIADSFGQQSVLTFSNIDINAPLPADSFQFKPPAGADVLRQ
ncbi:MAG: outer membrane lipoprotein chaperone LolA [Desulfovibrionaceae bacterium]|nr:outer membrane lipoprotein chaperone LolA [Desulfovibrionaceae bacterium]